MMSAYVPMEKRKTICVLSMYLIRAVHFLVTYESYAVDPSPDSSVNLGIIAGHAGTNDR